MTAGVNDFRIFYQRLVRNETVHHQFVGRKGDARLAFVRPALILSAILRPIRIGAKKEPVAKIHTQRL